MVKFNNKIDFSNYTTKQSIYNERVDNYCKYIIKKIHNYYDLMIYSYSTFIFKDNILDDEKKIAKNEITECDNLFEFIFSLEKSYSYSCFIDTFRELMEKLTTKQKILQNHYYNIFYYQLLDYYTKVRII